MSGRNRLIGVSRLTGVCDILRVTTSDGLCVAAQLKAGGLLVQQGFQSVVPGGELDRDLAS